MKRKSTSLSTNLPPMKLYLDDIEEICDALVKAGSKPLISTDNFDFEDIADLTKLRQNSVRELSISSKNPYLSLEFRPYKALLYVGGDSLLEKGIFEHIKSTCMKRQSNLINAINSKWTGMILSSALGVSIALRANPIAALIAAISFILFLFGFC